MRRLARFPAPSAALLGAAVALAGCTGTRDVLQPSALLGPDTAPQTEFSIEQTQPQPQGQQQVAAVRTDARVQFAPVVGATAEASTPLAARISVRAAERGIPLVGAGDTAATHIMKGYFSAISESGETTVIYVWDVLDPAGTRIHRIQGQVRSPAQGGDGWTSVQPATMETVADQTVDQLAAWLAARPG